MTAYQTELAVVGGGPGGYSAAFLAAERGKQVTIIEREAKLGGVCLHHGCIPSKAYLESVHLIHEAARSAERGIVFDRPRINPSQLRSWKESVVAQLAEGLGKTADRRAVKVLVGRAHFEDSHSIRVETEEGQQFVHFEHAIVATGSKPIVPEAFDLGNPRVMTSREALELEEIPKRLLVIGGGYIGMELGSVYAALGSEVHLVEALDNLLAGADRDLVKPVRAVAERRFASIRLQTKVKTLATSHNEVKAVLANDSGETEETYDYVLVSVGRGPNTEDLGLSNTAVEYNDTGFIKTNSRQQTTEQHIYAVGDVAGGELLAHKAMKEGRLAVEAILHGYADSDNLLVPSVVFTDPEVAWVGLTEQEAARRGQEVKISKRSWLASGRAYTMGATDGVSKLVIDPASDRVLGAGITGRGASEMISELTLGIEMGATALDFAETIHPHPTLSETIMEAGLNRR